MRAILIRVLGTFGGLALLAVITPVVVSPDSTRAATNRTGFGFNATLSGFPTGTVRVTGGGSYQVPLAPGDDQSIKSNGGFRCIEAVNQGPLTGCDTGEGVRWDTVDLLPAIAFKCNGASDDLHTVQTDGDTVALIADFYRAGDGIDESFSSVPMFVSAQDERPDLPGNQNVWIAGVGCGDGQVHFSR